MEVPLVMVYRTRAIISRGLYFFIEFSLWLRLILQTIYVLKMEILHFLSSKSAAYKQERLMMARVRYKVRKKMLVVPEDYFMF